MRKSVKLALVNVSACISLVAGSAVGATPAWAAGCRKVEASSIKYYQFPTGNPTLYPHRLRKGAKVWVDGHSNSRYYVRTKVGEQWWWGWINDGLSKTKSTRC
ncbi:hypothetical protein GCM10017600_05360 [Streptosporangium carneum]|uniref:SH3 domain-containing protein n=1 Tax=Streptosporangium carneum TaxID=47481 RepID=A0A9W6HWL2_9ACTN|nr:hypothetical protein GCM10017600_05360 [Streptosporangium carneum]